MSAVDAFANADESLAREVGDSLGFLRVVEVRGPRADRVIVRCSRCTSTSETGRVGLLGARHTLFKRAGCAHCYKSRILFRDGERLLTLVDASKEMGVSLTATYYRLKKMEVDVMVESVIELSEIRACGRADGIVPARRKYAVGDRVGIYTVQGFVRGGIYTMVCPKGHVRGMTSDAAEARKQCGVCTGYGTWTEVEVGGRKMRIEAFARMADLSVGAVMQRLKKGQSPESVLFARRWDKVTT